MLGSALRCTRSWIVSHNVLTRSLSRIGRTGSVTEMKYACEQQRFSSNRSERTNKDTAKLTNSEELQEFTTSAQRGLFGLRGLHQAEDFPKLAEQCITRCNVIRTELRERLVTIQNTAIAPSLEHTEQTLALLDAISNEVCRIIDAAEVCRNVHAQPEFREAAERVFSILSNYISQLNADIILYKMVCAVIDGPAHLRQLESTSKSSSTGSHAEKSEVVPGIFAKLSEEQQLVALDLRREFEADGIHLGLLAAEGGPRARIYEEKSHRLAALHADVTACETAFMQSAASVDNALFVIGPFGHTTTDATLRTRVGPAELAERAREAAQMRAFGLQVRQWLHNFAPQSQLASLKQGTGAGTSIEASGFLRSKLGGLFAVNDSPHNGGSNGSFPDTNGEYAVCTSRKHISRSLLVSVHPSPVRAQVWTGSVGEPAINRDGLGALVRARQALAAELGYSSYAEKVLSNSVAGSEQEVWAFLTEAADKLRPYAQQELQQLQQLAGKESMHAWDVAYWSNMQRIRTSDTSTKSVRSGSSDPLRISEYFPLDASVDALADITQCLFGLRLRREYMAPGEAWLATRTRNSSGDNSVGAGTSDAGTFKLVLESSDGVRCGTVYMDLHQRPDKFTGAAHFTIQCGCAHSEDGANGSNQLPVVALVFNFPASDNGSGVYAPPLLSLGDLTTLFHEWGHALHSLLSKTTYQHLSGTRGPLDFVEVPSHLFEHFTTDERCLQRWARHHITGRSPPASMLQEALSTRRNFEALEASSQVLYSLVDQHIFGQRMGIVTDMRDDQVYARTVSAALALQKEHTVLPTAPLTWSSSATNNSDDWLYVRRTAADLGIPGETYHPSMFLPSHSHFVTYGGGYYAYLYVSLSIDAWLILCYVCFSCTCPHLFFSISCLLSHCTACCM